MRIYEEIVIDMHTGETIYEDSFNYDGPLMELQDWDPNLIPDMNEDGIINALDVYQYSQALQDQGYTLEEVQQLITQGVLSSAFGDDTPTTSFDPEAIAEFAAATSNFNPQAVENFFSQLISQQNNSNPVYQATASSVPAPSATKSVLDWASFWSDTNVPVLGYDGLGNNLVVLKGADYSADGSKDLRVFNMTNGTWTKGDTKFSGSADISNMMTAPVTNELIAMHLPGNDTGANQIKRFKAHQPASISSQTVSIVTPFFDFGSSGNSKRLYKVKVLCTGTNLDDLAIVASYDGDTDTYSNIFSSNAFTNISDAAKWSVQTFTVSAPTDFVNISIKIYSTGAMTDANWGISEIIFIYREKGLR